MDDSKIESFLEEFMNIIIVGCGRVGRSIAEQLNTEEHSITVIDTDPECFDRIEDTQNILAIEGNGATLNILKEASVETAEVLIAVTATDELNIYTCFLAKQCGVPTTIARVRNPEYNKDMKALSDVLSLTMMINPEETAAREISRLLKYPGAIQVSNLGSGLADLITVKIAPGCVIANKKVADCYNILRDYMRICLIKRGDDIYIPNGDFLIEPGDMMTFIAPSKAAQKLLRLLGYETVQDNYAIILGGGKTSFYLAKLLKEAGMNTKIIEKNIKRCEELSDTLNGVMVINGNAMDEELLTSEGIERADAVVSLLATDEENVLVSLYAQQVNKKADVITELGNLKLSSIIDNLPLARTIMPKQLTGEYIVRYVRALHNAKDSSMQTMYKLGNGQAEALEFLITNESKITGIPLSKLAFKPMLQVGAIIRNSRIVVPTGSETIEKNDRVFIITKQKNINSIEDILR